MALLCRYVARPAVAEDRLKMDFEGKVIDELKKAYHDGTTHLIFSPMELMEKLAALMPKPWANLTRYSGVLAPNAKYRSQIVPQDPSPQQSEAEKEQDDPSLKNRRMSWARLLKRIFDREG